MKKLMIITKLAFAIIIPLSILSSISSCQKDTVAEEVQQVQEQTGNPCKVLTYQGYDGTGTEVTRFQYYYTGEQLDSVLSFNYGVLGAKSIYSYSSPVNRQGTNINASSGQIMSYTVDSLDQWGNIVKSVLNDNLGHYVSEAAFTYSCD